MITASCCCCFVDDVVAAAAAVVFMPFLPFADQLKSRLNLNTDQLIKLSSNDELKAEVDSAIVGQIVNPLRMKNRLVSQLKTQIVDLEMFIQFLQSETSTMVPTDCGGCG